MRRTLVTVATMLIASAGCAFAAPPAMEADSSLGKILVDQKGMTLYTFDKDEAGKSNCYDNCATNWPPLMAEEGATEEGDWTIVERTGGGRQWAYDGKPVYLWVKDSKPGDVTGDNVNNVWHIIKAD